MVSESSISDSIERIRRVLVPPSNPEFPKFGFDHIFGIPCEWPIDYRTFIECYGVGFACTPKGMLRFDDISTTESSAKDGTEVVCDTLRRFGLLDTCSFPHMGGLVEWASDDVDKAYLFRTNSDLLNWEIVMFDRTDRLTALHPGVLRLLENAMFGNGTEPECLSGMKQFKYCPMSVVLMGNFDFEKWHGG